MSTALATSIAVTISLLLIVILGKRRKPKYTLNDPSLCRKIIAGGLKHEDQPSILSPHQAKAMANRHLPIAFGIDNAFTRTDSVHASMFVEKVKPLINLSAKQWHNTSEFARVTASHWVENGFPVPDHSDGSSCHEGKQKPSNNKINVDRNRINVASLAQILSLKVVLWLFFNQKTQPQTCDENILNLAQSINRVWISSKLNSAEKDIPRFEDDVLLQTSLVNIFGKHDHPEDNPLNLILPSFETMWRVVLRAFLEIRFATGKEVPVWRDTMIAFSENPTKPQFDAGPASPSSNEPKTGDTRCVQSSPSAKHIVLESLRLYVPTRHIHRAYQWDRGMGTSHEIKSADIEGCHLRSDIWGSDSGRFIPDRWSALTPAQGDAFMPFGCPPFECPAKPTFGPRMIGVLVGALLTALEDEQAKSWTLDCEDASVLEHLTSGKKLCPHRNAYTDLYLVRSME
ncbi:Cytochrome P450 [Penicillium camemberti]|uniref:Cytochrome P450 n=1 Tax=Penicillium camemberti (strain FM 013) TaxID=1429867 RepID=A0A0G4PGE4_PENC3|nr:Cytochrome P450 [Penicillium camemberti]